MGIRVCIDAAWFWMRSCRPVLLFAVALSGVLVLWIVTWALRYTPDAELIPVERRLAEITGASTRVDFIVPEGELYHFVIAVPSTTTLSGASQGSLTVMHDTSEVYHTSFELGQLMECNWLDQLGLRGYIVTWHDGSERLSAVLHPGESYEITVALEQVPATPTSLWLTYLQEWNTQP
jgi:hypothetical protein